MDFRRFSPPWSIEDIGAAFVVIEYARVASNLRRLLEAVGLRRRAKPVEDLYAELERKRDERLKAERLNTEAAL